MANPGAVAHYRDKIRRDIATLIDGRTLDPAGG